MTPRRLRACAICVDAATPSPIAARCASGARARGRRHRRSAAILRAAARARASIAVCHRVSRPPSLRARRPRLPGATAILMTEKDAVKCMAFADARCWVPAGPARHRSRARRAGRERSSVDPKLLEILVCPVTKGPLVYDRERQELISKVGAARLPDPRRHPGDARGRGAQARAVRVRVTRERRRGDASGAPRPARRVNAARHSCSPSSFRRATRRRGCPASRWPTSAASRWSCASPSARGERRGARGGRHRRRAHPRGRRAHGIDAVLTRADHPTGTDRLAEAAAQLGLDDERHRRQRAGRRAADRARADPRGRRRADARMPTRRSPPRATRSTTPPRRSIRTSSRSCSIAPATRCISAARRFRGRATRSPPIGEHAAARAAAVPPLRPVRVSRRLPARTTRRSRRRRSSASRRSSSCARCGTATASSVTITRRHAGARRRHAGGSRRACARCSPRARFDRRLRFRPESRRASAGADRSARSMPSTHQRFRIMRLILLGPPGAGKGTQATFITRDLRHSADLHRRHAARRRQGRHAARARGEEGDGLPARWSPTTSSSPGQGTAAASPIAPTAICSTASRARFRRPTR